MDWKEFVSRLNSVAGSIHQLEPPIPPTRIPEEEARLGKIPKVIVDMVSLFNGGELFIDADALVTIFGFSPPGDPPESDWYVDRFTPIWRSKMNRPNDWAIGMTTYGGIYVLDDSHQVREWDSSSKRWSGEALSIDQWAESILSQGQAYLEEQN